MNNNFYEPLGGTWLYSDSIKAVFGKAFTGMRTGVSTSSRRTPLSHTQESKRTQAGDYGHCFKWKKISASTLLIHLWHLNRAVGNQKSSSMF